MAPPLVTSYRFPFSHVLGCFFTLGVRAHRPPAAPVPVFIARFRTACMHAAASQALVLRLAISSALQGLTEPVVNLTRGSVPLRPRVNFRQSSAPQAALLLFVYHTGTRLFAFIFTGELYVTCYCDVRFIRSSP